MGDYDTYSDLFSEYSDYIGSEWGDEDEEDQRIASLENYYGESNLQVSQG